MSVDRSLTVSMEAVDGIPAKGGICGAVSFSSNSNTGAGYLRRDLWLALLVFSRGCEGGNRDGGLNGLDMLLSLLGRRSEQTVREVGTSSIF